jgi:CheY-like chemotaxis protein
MGILIGLEIPPPSDPTAAADNSVIGDWVESSAIAMPGMLAGSRRGSTLKNRAICPDDSALLEIVGQPLIAGMANHLSNRGPHPSPFVLNSLQISVCSTWHNGCRDHSQTPEQRVGAEIGNNKQNNDMKPPNFSAAQVRSGSCDTNCQHSAEPDHAHRILIADDDECIRELVTVALTRDGYDVSATADGEQAWTEMHHEHYDLLLTDNEMPRLQGVQLIERMRHEGLSLPVIVTSGTFSLHGNQTAPELDIAAVLPKPFELSELLKLVQDALHPAVEPVPSAGGKLPQPNSSR